MKKVAWILASGALIMACGGGPSRTDAGPTGNDTGAIVLMDSGPSTMRDTGGGGGRDTGPAATMCGPWAGLTATSISAVPASCMPRCSAATLTTVNGCMDSDCLGAALMADTTAPINMTFEGGMGTSELELDCQFCFVLQQFHCASVVCPMYASPALVCDNTTDADMCMGEFDALNGCLDALSDTDQMTFDNCFQESVGACFDAGGGFLPSGARLGQFSRNIVMPSRPVLH